MELTALGDAQARFYHRYLDAVRAISGALPLAEVEAGERSPCFVAPPDAQGLARWQPVRCGERTDLSMFATPLHDDIRAWFSDWMRLAIEATAGDDTFVLFGAASVAERERVLRAAVAWMAQRSDGLVPIAATYDGRRVCASNGDSAVYLVVASSAQRIAPSIAAWLDALTPVPL